MTSIAEYNNNPGNIRPAKGVTYEGMLGVDDKGFAIFESPEQGNKALINDITHKIEKRGIKTPSAFVDVYAPASDENSEEARENYKIFLAHKLGLKSTNDPFPEKSVSKIAQAVASFEGGTAFAGKDEETKAPSSGSQYGSDTVAPPPPGGKDSKGGMSRKQEAGIIGATAGALTGATTATLSSAYDFIKNALPKGASMSPEQLEKLAQIVIQNQADANGQIGMVDPSGQVVNEMRISPAGKDAGRLAAEETGSMPYNYAKSAGLTDIEAAQALDMTKNEGGVHDLTSKRREGTNKVKSLFPGETYVENPNFGGLLTLDQGGGKGPKQSFKVQGALPTADLPPDYMPGPAAPPPEGTLVQLPKAEPTSTSPNRPAPPKLNTKEKIMAAVNNRMAALKDAATEIPSTFSRVAPVAGKTVLGGLAGYGTAYNAQDAYEKLHAGDTIGGTTAGLASAASAASLIPKMARFAGPVAVGLTTANQMRDDIKSGNNQGAAESGLSGLTALFPRLFGPVGAALYSRGLNEGEDEELARRRAMPATLSR